MHNPPLFFPNLESPGRCGQVPPLVPDFLCHRTALHDVSGPVTGHTPTWSIHCLSAGPQGPEPLVPKLSGGQRGASYYYAVCGIFDCQEVL